MVYFFILLNGKHEVGQVIGEIIRKCKEVIQLLDILMIAVILSLGGIMLGLIRWADSVIQKGSDK